MSQGGELGLFEGHQDIGKTTRGGSASFDPAQAVYSVSGGGENMWFTNDAFHFLWTRVTGDFALSASPAWPRPGGNAHRKACLMVRRNLDAASAYVDVAVHGDGLTSLQYRESDGGPTREIQANVSGPFRVGIVRQGRTFFMTLPGSGAPLPSALAPAGAYQRLDLGDSPYVGLAVCAHDDKALEEARFAQVDLTRLNGASDAPTVLHCSIETVPIASKDRRVIYHTRDHIEAPNWTRDGLSLLFNSGGRMYRLPVKGGVPERIDTGFAVRCNNDHGLSPDGSRLVVSDQTRDGKSRIYTLPIGGGEPALVTPLAPSYWHGWSPDGSTLAYCAERNGQFDIYTIPAAGGEEKRLTSAPGLDDGPDYSPDGKYIYFNSDRTGSMHIWRMTADGSEQEQLTFDECNDWFPHPSPDGRWLVFISYDKDVKGHPANQPVRLRLMPTAGGPIQELARLFGGQGTLNVPSWSPDSRQVAFVSYELLRP